MISPRTRAIAVARFVAHGFSVEEATALELAGYLVTVAMGLGLIDTADGMAIADMIGDTARGELVVRGLR